MNEPATTPRRILRVCIGNRMRSPLAQRFLHAELDSAGWSHLQVDSAATRWPRSWPRPGSATRSANWPTSRGATR
ncbi:arsenate reductase/protein-tyrosine-phosphatase family protein [Hydrogenophaga sp.]|uniref:arsenate reductase/protein-tyrosine-phosphatase family protein n=1 Tax=Hydrogenophaga sp. TaxID=1904254 RepID=UPI002FC93B92